MSKAKTDIQLILDAASKKDVKIYFINDPESLDRHQATHIYNKKHKTLKIFVGNLPQKHEAKIFSIIRDRFNENGIIQKVGQEKDLQSYEDYKKKNKYEDLLSFFENKIPEQDLIALKVSLFMISEKDKGKEIHKYKKTIRERFGERGMTIANLCNAGYFESEFKPKYEDEGKAEFEKYYEICVGRNARAIFVHSGMTFRILYTAFLTMLRKCKELGVRDFRVHAFGNQNTNLTKDVLEQIQINEEGKFALKIDEREHSYITCDVTLADVD